MPLPLRESQVCTELAKALVDFLPGTAHPYASADISFPGAAQAAHASTPWNGSKLPALSALLAGTLERERTRFCPLIEEIVRRALIYRATKTPITREDIVRVNDLLVQLQFKIPALHQPAFLAGLPKASPPPAAPAAAHGAGTASTPTPAVLADLLTDLAALAAMKPVPRGTAFERFLAALFSGFGLAPRHAFSLTGEQIDGSFVLDNVTYLLEAKWKGEKTGNRELAAFNDQVGARAEWARGLFVSYAGFSDVGLDAFARGRSSRIVLVDSMDLYHVLRGAVDLREVLRAKVRKAVEDGRAFVPVTELFPNV